jgi:predicted nucleotidyltransferase
MLLRDQDKQTLLQLFFSINMPFEVWAYGSRVNGTAHAGSDLDLVIKSQNHTSMPIKEYLALQEKIKESNIPILVELRDWTKLPESFHKNIEQNYEVLFSNLETTENKTY